MKNAFTTINEDDCVLVRGLRDVSLFIFKKEILSFFRNEADPHHEIKINRNLQCESR